MRAMSRSGVCENDGILTVAAPFSPLTGSTKTPTPTQLLEVDAIAQLDGDIYQTLLASPDLIGDVADIVTTKFLQPSKRRVILIEAAPTIAKGKRSYWWVSQNRTYHEEVNGDFMWSPQTNIDGRRNPNYEFMRQVASGDVVFSFTESQIKAIGIVKQHAVSSPKPTTFGSRGSYWLNDGWLVEVAFYDLGPAAFRPSDHMELIRPTLPNRYAPIRPNGIGNQLYLAPIPREMADVLLSLIGPVSDAIVENVSTVLLQQEALEEDEEALDQVEGLTNIDFTEKQQLILARRGQGLFRTQVYQVERRCRVTFVAEKIHWWQVISNRGLSAETRSGSTVIMDFFSHHMWIISSTVASCRSRMTVASSSLQSLIVTCSLRSAPKIGGES